MTDQPQENQSKDAGSLSWLAIGALAGLLLAGYGLLERTPGNPTLPPGAAARVNDTVIEQEQLDRAVASLRGTRPDDVGAAERHRILEQLVDEELLVQRGAELDMLNTEATVRAAIVQSMVASVTAEADAADPNDEELKRFLDDNAERYTFAQALGVDAWVSDQETSAQTFVARLRDDPDASPADSVRRVPGLPQGPVPIQQLRMFVGPAVAAAALNMPAGSSAVYARQGRWYVVRVNQHAESVRASLDSVRSQVLLDYRRDLANRQLRTYLERLRQQSDVVLPPLP